MCVALSKSIDLSELLSSPLGLLSLPLLSSRHWDLQTPPMVFVLLHILPRPAHPHPG